MAQWFTPLQRDKGYMEVWVRITREEIDHEDILSQPCMTYFNRPFAVPEVKCEYDLKYHDDNVLDIKSKREDRHNLDVVRDHIHNEEKNRIIPLCTSQAYGHRASNLEMYPDVSHKKQATIKDLMARHNINLKPRKKFPPENCVPLL